MEQTHCCIPVKSDFWLMAKSNYRRKGVLIKDSPGQNISRHSKAQVSSSPHASSPLVCLPRNTKLNCCWVLINQRDQKYYKMFTINVYPVVSVHHQFHSIIHFTIKFSWSNKGRNQSLKCWSREYTKAFWNTGLQLMIIWLEEWN